MEQITQITGITAETLLKRIDLITSNIEVILKQLSINPTEKPDYLTRNEVKKLFQVSFPTIHNWTNKGIIKPYHVGKKVYYKRSELESVLNSKQQA